jgi:hypothetical protein
MFHLHFVNSSFGRFRLNPDSIRGDSLVAFSIGNKIPNDTTKVKN